MWSFPQHTGTEIEQVRVVPLGRDGPNPQELEADRGWNGQQYLLAKKSDTYIHIYIYIYIL